MLPGILMIAAALGIGGYLLEHRPKSSKASKIALGNGYSVIMGNEGNAIKWALVYEFTPDQIVASGLASTPEQAAIQARMAMVADAAKRNLTIQS
jgi:hypothetical protein